MSWREIYRARKTTAGRALRLVRRGARVFVGSACAEPRALVQALMQRADDLHDVEILHFITLSEPTYTEKRFDRRFRHNAFFIGPSTREAVNRGRADYTPAFMHEIPDLFRRRDVELDVALIQVSPPDEHGWVSLGIGVDVARAAAETAKKVIAQVNHFMPRTMGNTFLPVSRFDAFVEEDEPLAEFLYPPLDEVGARIAGHVAKLINDGDTLHIGYGHIPYGVLGHLGDKRDLGLHTEVVADAMIDLLDNGVITGDRKNHYPHRVVASFCIGSRRMYDYVDLNPNFLFLPSEVVYNPLDIARNHNMVSVGSAQEVDLSGQVSSESLGYSFYSGLGGRLDFMRGAAMSRGGRSIMVLPSTNRAGDKSRIVHHLGEGAGVVATRGDLHYVVTEYGIAYLKGRTVRERALALINIAHPHFRQELLDQAKAEAYVYPDQILLTAEQDLYPEWAETTAVLGNGAQVSLRPIKPTDEILMQEFFYSHSDATIYNRYFRPVRALPHVTAQGLVNLDYDKDMALVATTGPQGREKIVGMGRYALGDPTGLAEVAYTVHDDWQGTGLGTVLQDHLTAYAKKKGVPGFWAVSFGSNKAMLKVFGKLGPYTKEVIEPDVWRVEHWFARDGGQPAAE
ncbi:MAG: GNAT family N-acetyltransferase [Deltaproteobacteria bacterium]|nr:GNAT family N-acetyltransferase [Deltaproteobacteria bacterium]